MKNILELENQHDNHIDYHLNQLAQLNAQDELVDHKRPYSPLDMNQDLRSARA